MTFGVVEGILEFICTSHRKYWGPTSVCLPRQDTGAGGIDWGDSEAAPIEIEIVDAGTDCNYLSFY